MVGNHTGEGEVGVSRGKGTEHIEVDGRPKRGVEIASQGTDTIRAEIHGKAVRLPVVADPDRGGARRCPCEPCGLKSAVGPLHGDAALAIWTPAPPRGAARPTVGLRVGYAAVRGLNGPS